MLVKYWGLKPYQPIFQAMKDFTASRSENTEDELWVVEHLPVYTQGKAGKAEHLLIPTDIPVVQSDRGGQITYHGPGQIIVYTLIDFGRRNISVRALVTRIEQAIIATLAHYHITANSDPQRPGVYVDGKKIASLGLRIRHNAVYHGLSLNLNMDLQAFKQINPCGYSGLEMTQITDYLNPCPHFDDVANIVVAQLIEKL